jgi:hypothetical protein
MNPSAFQITPEPFPPVSERMHTTEGLRFSATSTIASEIDTNALLVEIFFLLICYSSLVLCTLMIFFD